MKKFWKQVSAVSFLAIYCLAIGIVCFQDYDHSSKKNSQKPTTETYTSIVSNGLLGVAVQPVKSGAAGINGAYSSFKNSFSEFSFLLRIVDKLFFSSFIQYQFFSTKVLLSIGKTDIIFPFHYFW